MNRQEKRTITFCWIKKPRVENGIHSVIYLGEEICICMDRGI